MYAQIIITLVRVSKYTSIFDDYTQSSEVLGVDR